MERKTKVPKALAKKRREKKPTLAQRVTAALAKKKKTRKAKKQLTLAQRVCCWPSWLSLIKGLSFSARFFNPSTAGMAVKNNLLGVFGWSVCFVFFVLFYLGYFVGCCSNCLYNGYLYRLELVACTTWVLGSTGPHLFRLDSLGAPPKKGRQPIPILAIQMFFFQPLFTNLKQKAALLKGSNKTFHMD